jgi:hypothetical protein
LMIGACHGYTIDPFLLEHLWRALLPRSRAGAP